MKLQVHVARGGRLEGEPPPPRGHAIEVRLNAEDPDAGFRARAGVVEHVSWPTGPGIRVDTGYATGDVIPADYDSMMAKVIAWGADREEARARLRRALADTTVLVQGGTTNKAFLAALLDHPDVAAGQFDTGWLDRLTSGLAPLAAGRSDVALVASAVAAADDDAAVERARFFAAAARGRAQGPHHAGFVAELQYLGHAYRLSVFRTGPHRYRLLAGGEAVEVDVETLGRFERRLTFGRDRFRVVSLVHGQDQAAALGNEDLIEVDSVPHRVGRDTGGVVRAPAPGVVVDVRVQVGDVVSAEHPVAVIESMKMEVPIRAGAPGRVTEVLVTPNAQVDAGRAPGPYRGRDRGGGGLRRAAGQLCRAGSGRDRRHRARRALPGHLGRHQESGAGIRLRPRRYRTAGCGVRRRSGPCRPRPRRRHRVELETLAMFGDLCMLNRNRRTDDAAESEATHNPRGYFLDYLQTLDAERTGLPASFVERLRRAVGHYGATDLEPGPALEESLHRIYLAQQRVATQFPAILAILDHHLQAADIPVAAPRPLSRNPGASHPGHPAPLSSRR